MGEALRRVRPPPGWEKWAAACERDFKGVLHSGGRWVPIEECIKKARLTGAIPKQRLAAGWTRFEAYTFPRRKPPTQRRGLKQTPYRHRAGVPSKQFAEMADGRVLSLKQLARETGISYTTLYHRHKAGARGEELLTRQRAGRKLRFAEKPPARPDIELPDTMRLPTPKKTGSG